MHALERPRANHPTGSNTGTLSVRVDLEVEPSKAERVLGVSPFEMRNAKAFRVLGEMPSSPVHGGGPLSSSSSPRMLRLDSHTSNKSDLSTPRGSDTGDRHAMDEVDERTTMVLFFPHFSNSCIL